MASGSVYIQGNKTNVQAGDNVSCYVGWIFVIRNEKCDTKLKNSMTQV